MQFIKTKTWRQPCFQFPNCVMYRQLAWYTPLIHWLPTTGYREEPGKQTAQSSVKIWNTSAALHWMEWWVYSWCRLANLFTRNLTTGVQGILSSSFISDVSLLWTAGNNNTNVLVIYNAVIAVLKEEAARPSKCLLFLSPIVRSLCSEDLKKPLTII